MSLAPPFTQETAQAKVKKAQDLWNTQSVALPILLARSNANRNPKNIAQAYTPNSIWRNRTSFIVGTVAIEELLTKKWEKEKNYCLRKELFAFSDDKIAVQFWYEFQDAHDEMKWKRCYGLEDWTFAEDGKMRKRQMSGNDVEISEAGEYPFWLRDMTLWKSDRYSVSPPCLAANALGDRWFKEGVDVNKVDISEAHW
jgi:nuclear transport factor 2 (NTF2) superfamily protein